MIKTQIPFVTITIVLILTILNDFVTTSPLLGLGSGQNSPSKDGQSNKGLLGVGSGSSSKPKKSSSKSSSKSKDASEDSNSSGGGGLVGGLMKAAGAPTKGKKSPKRGASKGSKKKGGSKKSKKNSNGGMLSPLLGGSSSNSRKKSPGFGFLMGSKGAKKSPDGYRVDEGDIAITDEDFLSKTIRSIELWRDGVVFYTFDESVNDTMKDLFNLAMKEWEDYTCLTFREKQAADQVFYGKMRTDNDGCYSFVGRQAKDILRGQDVNLGAGCDSLHTAIHEIGHMIGLSHEQSRSDRDNYIRINFDNIEDELYDQFSKQKTRNEEAEYDYKSVMQYPSWGFSVAPFEKITMSTLNPSLQYLIDEERQGLSFKDIKVVNKMYKCQSRCSEQKVCSNNGALVPYKSESKSECVCMCPNGYEGETCEDPIDRDVMDEGVSDDNNEIIEYYGGLRCGGNVTEETSIKTPERSLKIPGCSWWIQAPEGKRVEVTFNEFDFRPKESFGIIDDKCIFEKVEIRTKGIYDPEIYCGTDLKGKTVTSVGSNFIIVIVGDIRGSEKLQGAGLEATIEFKDGAEEVDDGGGGDGGEEGGLGGVVSGLLS